MTKQGKNQSSDPKHYILTGVTGSGGLRLLCELVRKISQENYEGELVLFIRAKDKRTAQERLKELYERVLISREVEDTDLPRLFKNNIRLVETDIRQLGKLSSFFQHNIAKYHLVHNASLTTFEGNASVYETIKHINYLGTLNLLQHLMPYLRKVTYISKIFTNTEEENKKEHISIYEKFNLQTEQEIMQICEGYGLEWEIISEVNPPVLVSKNNI